MLRLALKMLYGDRAKYAMLVCGLTFCSLLMTQQSSVFCGLMLLTTATLMVLLLLSIMSMAARTYNPFIYFRF